MEDRDRPNSCGSKSYTREKGDGWEAWGGYMAAKKAKLNDQFLEKRSFEKNSNSHGSAAQFFKGVIIHVDGYTKPSSDELKRLMMIHGGHYEHYLSKRRVTHVIATNLTNSKITKHLKHCKVVRPEWIVDCVKAGRLLSYIPYLLYTSQSRIQQGLVTYSKSSIKRQTTVQQNTFDNANSTELSDDFENQNVIDEEDEIREDSYSDVEKNDIDNFFNDISEDEDDNSESLNDISRKRNVNIIEDRNTERKRKCEGKSTKDSQYNEGDCDHTFLHSSNKKEQNESEMGEEICVDTASSKSKSSTSPANAGDPQYLSEFYNHSRLHHLSTWKSEWRAYVNKLQNERPEWIGRKKLVELQHKKNACLPQKVGRPKRVIMHIDLDCFFVSVGLRKRPDLRGKPVAVTHSRGQGQKNPIPRSDLEYERKHYEKKRQQGSRNDQKMLMQSYDVSDKMEENVKDSSKQPSAVLSDSFHSMAEIASCSYEARQAGIKNGMFMGTARNLCPQLQTIPYDFEGYQEVSKCLYDTVASYTHDMEAVSCDEMLVDCTDLLAATAAEPLEFAALLRQEIFEKTNCTASVGMGPSILLAKMATRKAKPNGQYYVQSETILDFMADQSVQNIPGVGWSLTQKLKSFNVRTCGELQKVTLSSLQRDFGPKTGQSLYRYCRGEDDRPVKTDQERKSVSAEINYGIRFQNDLEADKFLMELAEEVHKRLANIEKKGKTVTLKLMVRHPDAPKETAKFMGHGVCNNISKSVTLPLATDDPKVIHKECSLILRTLKLMASDLRGIGIQVQRLESAVLGPGTRSKAGQSILNFTLAKPNTSNLSETNTTTRKESHNGSSSTKEVCSILHKQKQKSVPSPSKSPSPKAAHSAGRGRHWMDSLHDMVPEDKGSDEVLGKTLQDSLRYTVSSLSDEQKHDSPPNNLNKGSPQYESGTNWSEALVNSRKETSTCGLPPLPSLEYISPPPISSPLPPASVEYESNAEPPPPLDYFPSPSQIDPDILQELPEEIRKQIEQEIKARKPKSSQTRSRPYHERHIPSHWYEPDDEKPGPSHRSEPVLRIPGEKIDVELTENDLLPLPSPSQIDKSCLNALPPELQQEIIDAYNQQKTTKNSKTSPAKTSTSPGKQRPSPNKHRSPGRGAKKQSPQFKVPHGKPARGRPKKLEFQDKTQPRIDDTSYNKNISTKAVSLNEDSGSSLRPRSAQAETNPEQTIQMTDSIEKDSKVEEETSVNLCGAVTIQEVRNLLMEWLQESSVPEKEDENVMITYLSQLIFSGNLEQLDLVVKFFVRRIRCMKNDFWEKSLERIINEMQSTMKSFYGGALKIPVK